MQISIEWSRLFLCNNKTETMKTIKTYLFLLIFPMCLGLVACSKDDAKEEQSSINSISPLVGTWGKTEMIAGDWVTTTLIFNANGTYSETSRIGSTTTLSESGKYSYNDTTKILVTVPTSGRSWTYFVVEVSDMSLVLMFSDYSGTTTYTKK